MTASAYLHWLSRNLTCDFATSEPSTRTKDAVLGYATGYSVADIAPFVRSLRSVFPGQIILVVDRNPALLAWLADHGVETVLGPETDRPWSPHPVVERFALWAQILQARPDIRRVVTTDVRDVVFQGDPFAESVGGLEFFVEADGRTLSQHAFNRKYLRALLGTGLSRHVGPRKCVCVGVVAGSSAAVLRFCRTVLLLCAIPRSHIGGAFGVDQAACNVIAHLDLLGGVIRENYSRVATIGLSASGRLAIQDGLIRNPDGSVSPIVHQYDRFPSLDAFVQGRWGVRAPIRRGRRTVYGRLHRLWISFVRRIPELR